MSKYVEDPTHGHTLYMDSRYLLTDETRKWYCYQTPKINRLRSLRLLGANLPTIPAMGGTFTVNNGGTAISVTLPTGRYLNGTSMAAAIQALITPTVPAFTVTYNEVTGKLTFTGTANVSIVFNNANANNWYSDRRNSTLMGMGPLNYTIAQDGNIVYSTTTIAPTPVGTVLTSPFPIDLRGCLWYNVQVDVLKSDAWASSLVDTDFIIPCNSVFGGAVTYGNQRDFRQAIQNTDDTNANQQLQSFFFTILDDLGAPINFGANPFVLIFNVTGFPTQ